ncbi:MULTISPECIES: hypothetical protein [unclassified Methylibium]|uniref:hypothetical protein n=1 Tax=unclassified Methylibium TaxID=2633235 RepID=UPI0006F97BA6|nr:hypothetical protein [Methylibium sp. Root1272]KQW74156.1 hypothetical protein ASC67_18510 [Methylibium sp. Root1272]
MALHPNSSLPIALPIGDALAQSEPLVRLQALLRESNARFDVIRPLLPAALAAQVRPGPVDEQGWALLAGNTAVAAKLRQLLPRFEAALQQQGWKGSAIRIRVQSS